MAKKMTFKKARKLSKHLVKINDIIPYINYGGCLFFAINLSKVLIEMGYSPMVVGVHDTPYVPKRNFLNTLEKINRGQWWGLTADEHYIVRVGKYFFDSEGWTSSIKPSDCLQMMCNGDLEDSWIVGEMELEQAEFLYRHFTGWNPTYNKKDNGIVVGCLDDVKNKLVTQL